MTIKIPLAWFAVLLFVVIEVILLYCFHRAGDQWRQTIVFGASIVAGAFGIFSYLKGIEEKRHECSNTGWPTRHLASKTTKHS